MAKNKLSQWIAFILLGAALCLPSSTSAQNANDRSSPGIIVLASSSLTEVMTELVRAYSSRTKKTVAAFFNAPNVLAESIQAGEPADLYISEDQTLFTQLKQQGLIDVFSLSNITQNELVLMGAVDNRISRLYTAEVPLSHVLEDVHERTMVVVPDPATTPTGSYAKTALERMGFWSGIEKNLVRTGSTKQALYLIAKGDNIGITYATEAEANPEVRIIARFPESLHPPIVYQAAVVAGLRMQEARDFLDFLKSPEGKRIFATHGFTT